MKGARNFDEREARNSSNIVSKLFMCWIFPSISYAKHHDVKTKELCEILPSNDCQKLTKNLERCWATEVISSQRKNKMPSLLTAVAKTFGWYFFWYSIPVILWDTIRIIQVFALRSLISYFNDKASYQGSDAYLFATIVVICTPINAIVQNKLFRGMRTLGMRVKISCSSVVYRKMLRLPQTSDGKVSAEKVINLLSADVAKFEQGLMFIHYLWSAPLNLVVIFCILWKIIGFPAIASGICISVSIPIELYCGKIIKHLRKKIATWADERILLTGEVIKGIRLIKMYNWEKHLGNFVILARKYEIDAAALTLRIKNVLSSFLTILLQSSSFIAVGLCVYQDSGLSSVEIFTMIAFISTLHSNMVYFCHAATAGATVVASIKRIQRFLILEEIKTDVPQSERKSDGTVVSLRQVRASWTQSQGAFCLNDINISIAIGRYYAIVGSVGSGKSSFLRLLLGEMEKQDGHISISGKISYASQEPWLFPGSVKDNILFGETYDAKRYKLVLSACALDEDIRRFPQGDDTFVGENGTALSGGQSSRINLARAVYRDAEIYLLDDPFSAVDTRVCKQIFEKCVNTLLEGKTRMIVTHNLSLIRKSDEIIFFKNGRVDFQGPYNNAQSNNEVAKLLLGQKQDDKSQPNDQKFDYDFDPDVQEHKDFPDEEAFENTELISGGKNFYEINSLAGSQSMSNRSHHTIKGSYREFLKTGNSRCLLTFTFISFIMSRVFVMAYDFWVTYWISSEESSKNKTMKASNNETVSTGSIDSFTGISVFGALLMAMIVSFFVKAVLFGTVCMNASTTIHKNMINRLLRAVTSFFDFNDSGTILNRFTKDLAQIDEFLPDRIFEFLFILETIIGVAMQITLVAWQSIFPFVLVMYLNWKIQSHFLKALKKYKKLETQEKSPVYSHVKSSNSGITTIRSYQAQKMVCQQFDAHFNTYTKAFTMADDSLMTFRLCVDMTFSIFIGGVIYSVLALEGDRISGAFIGLIISQLLMISTRLQRLMGLFAELSMYSVVLKRLFEYTNLEDENHQDAVEEPPRNWPHGGKIVFDSLYLSYASSEKPVLKDLCFVIEAGMKVGIVGRTGAGKSSLISALFQLAKIDGSILIDDIDTKNIKLSKLRTSISILPQEPILFSVSLRQNLDPSMQIEDAALWAALQELELHKTFKSLDEKIDWSSLSVGQRQLLCLARVVLKKNKILILDEATASADDHTDALIHRTIQHRFKDCTVLTIAHRLNTVMNSDKILVLDSGRVVEFDDPKILLTKEDGFFSKMLQSGDNEGHCLTANIIET
ncbi:hypothetical protein QAD02_010353 [Eretmocerus hayati]|uniref:Uncharacterized protein n=1 Tax=Eretmocerus hayati TaxID=131215 RepID=A0ACC2NC05_9HYME|nr:hypothetical protein QAD02_010353 [Eretmocerus hayati]